MGRISTSIQTCSVQNLHIYVVFDEESDLLGLRTQSLTLDQVLFLKNVSYNNLRSNFNTRENNSREHYRFFGHLSEPCGNLGTILRQHLPIITPDLPIPTRRQNSSVKPEFSNPKCLYKTETSSRLLTTERIYFPLCGALLP